MSLTIQGLGTALPENAVSQMQAAEIGRRLGGSAAEPSDALVKLYRQAGIETATSPSMLRCFRTFSRAPTIRRVFFCRRPTAWDRPDALRSGCATIASTPCR